jgi:hypothetical protein
LWSDYGIVPRWHTTALVWGSGRAKKFQVIGNRSKKRLHRAIIKEGLGYIENGGHILSGEFDSLQFGVQYDGLSMKFDLNRAETVVSVVS